MLRGLYSATSGLITQQRKHDTVTNNISNLNTPGFKSGTSVARSFPEMLIARINDSQTTGTNRVGRMSTGVFAEENPAIYLQGDLQETQNPYDLALTSNIQVPGVQFDVWGRSMNENGERVFQPQAFFTVQGTDGEPRYTRNGKFTVDSAGQLVTSDGYLVLDSNNQPIIMQDPVTGEALKNVRVNGNGGLENEQGQLLWQLQITRVDNPQKLLREGNGVYRFDPEEDANGVAPVAIFGEEVQIKQGFIERSNVDSTQSMVDMMAAVRAYEANQKVIQSYDRSLEKAVNEIGRV